MASYDDPTLHRLLDLQAEDTAMARLRERRASLPEAARLADVDALLAELEADLEIARKQNDEVAREQSRLEGEIELIDSKSGREEQRMMSGKVANPKELSALQAEIESLKRRRSSIEDQLLDVMVQREGSEATVDKLEAERVQAAAEKDELSAAVARLSGDIDTELAEREATRQEVATAIPEDLMALYEKIRSTKHGVGAAALQAGTCSGCHTKLPAIEAERIRKERGLQRCDNCRRILVVA
jgi:predicted  nucleic acid-binding Zn-ribbon protein